MTAVMIGVDPHKGSHTATALDATALDATEHELACLGVRLVAGRWSSCGLRLTSR